MERDGQCTEYCVKLADIEAVPFQDISYRAESVV